MYVQANVLEKLKHSFTEKSLGKDNDDEIISLLEKVLFEIVDLDYSSHRGYVANLSHEIHHHRALPVPYLLSVYMGLLEALSYKDTITRRFVLDSNNKDCEVDVTEILEKFYHTSTIIVMHEFTPPATKYSDREMYGLIRSLIDYGNRQSIDKDEIHAEIQHRMLLFSFSRYYSKQIGVPNEYYVQFKSFIEIISREGYFQKARDLAEEALLCSFLDEEKPFGYLTHFSIFTQQLNISEALLYGALMLVSALKAPNLDFDLKKDIFFHSFTFMRNFNFIKYGEDIYFKYLLPLPISEYDKQKVETAYFYLLLNKEDITVVTKATNFLRNNLENILKYGSPSCLPWYTILNNIKYLFPKEYSAAHIEDVEKKLVDVVGNSVAANIKDKTLKGRKGSKAVIIEGLKQLTQSRNVSDVVSESNVLVITANRVLGTAVKEEDIESILLSHLVKSDASIAFTLSTSLGVEIIPLTFEVSPESVEMFDRYKDCVSNILALEKRKTFLWIGAHYENIYTVQYDEIDGFRSGLVPSCSLSSIRSWLRNALPSLGFEESRKSGEFIITYEEFWEENSATFNAEVPQVLLDIDAREGEIVVFTDVSISPFPHNLLMTRKKEFISTLGPITNALSFDNYRKHVASFISLDTVNLWAPTEEGDFAICQAFSKVMDNIGSYNIDVSESIIPSFKKYCDLNIFIAHGGRDEKTGFKYILPSSGKVYLDAGSVLGAGKIAVLFVCHSGSVTDQLFSNAIHSLIKDLFSLGYEAVIAPAWSLNIYIPGVWCGRFLDSLMAGDQVSYAVYNANMRIKEVYKEETAWAAMHLFGNPNLSTTNASGGL